MTRRSLRPALALLAAFAFVSIASPARADDSDPSAAGVHSAKVENFLASLHPDTGNVSIPAA